jgi:hypothetical protein
MDTALLLILMIIGNFSLYWVFFGSKKLKNKLKQKEVDNGREVSSTR